MGLLIKNSKIVMPDTVLIDHVVYLENKKIKKIIHKKDAYKMIPSNVEVVDVGNNFLAPGLVDVHIQGYRGFDVWGDADSIINMQKAVLKTGTTSFLATTHYDENVIKNIAMAIEDQEEEGANIVGIHLEGPFINPQSLGMIKPESIRSFKKGSIKKIQGICRGNLKLMTIAPEMKGSDILIDELKREGVVIAIGHTKADYDTACSSFNSGVRHVTHLFNAMESIHHRHPNAAVSSLLDDRVFVQVIADGHHIHPAVLELILQLKMPEKAVLITDAVKAAGLKDGKYEVYGLKLELKHGAIKSIDGRLAGSVISLLEAVKNMIKFTSASLVDVVKMASYTPARSIGIDRKKGSIRPGRDADLIVFNEKFKLLKIIKSGEIIL